MNETAELQVLDLAPIEQEQPQPRRDLAVTDNTHTSIMLALVEKGASMEQMEKMMDLLERQDQREVERGKREAKKAFRSDFAAFRGENVIIPKTKEVDRGRGGSFMQAEYDEVCRRLSPALARHGFGFRHDQKFGAKRWMTEGVENDVGWVWVTCHLEHKLGHTESLELEGPPGDLTVNTPTQNMQTTASYLKRQSLLAITGTATGGEDDEAKMRKQSAGDEGGASDDAEERVLQAGREASMEGMAKLTAWWGGLSAKERSRLNQDFGQLRKAAAAADARGAAQ